MRRYALYLLVYLIGMSLAILLWIISAPIWIQVLLVVLFTLWLIFILIAARYTSELRQELLTKGMQRWISTLVVTDDDMKDNELFTLVWKRVHANSDKLNEMIYLGISRNSLPDMFQLYNENEYLCSSWCNLVELYESGKDYTVLYDSLIGKLEQ